MAKKVPQAYTEKVGQKPTYEVPGAYTEQSSARGELKDPIKIFKKGFESGGYNVAANLNYFSALANSIRGDEKPCVIILRKLKEMKAMRELLWSPLKTFINF